MTGVIPQHIEIVEGAGGPKALIAGHRIRVMDIAIWHEKMGMSPEQIVAEFPTISLADVHAALAYYRDHRDEVDRFIEAHNADAEELRRIIGEGPLAEKLRQRSSQ